MGNVHEEREQRLDVEIAIEKFLYKVINKFQTISIAVVELFAIVYTNKIQGKLCVTRIVGAV